MGPPAAGEAAAGAAALQAQFDNTFAEEDVLADWAPLAAEDVLADWAPLAAEDVLAAWGPTRADSSQSAAIHS